jgi:transposase
VAVTTPFAAMPMLVEVPAATAYRYDRDVLEADLPPPNFDNIRALLVDEKAVHKGHGYVTSVLNADTGELLHLHEGKKKASLEAFFENLNDEQKASVEAVCIDRNGAYRAVIKEQMPYASVVYDRFHLIQNINRAIDEVRREEYRKADAEGKNVIKGQRFNLYRHPENLTEAGEKALSYLLEINRKLNISYV